MPRTGNERIQGFHEKDNRSYPDIMYIVFEKRITATIMFFCYQYSYDIFKSVLVMNP